METSVHACSLLENDATCQEFKSLTWKHNQQWNAKLYKNKSLIYP